MQFFLHFVGPFWDITLYYLYRFVLFVYSMDRVLFVLFVYNMPRDHFELQHA